MKKFRFRLQPVHELRESRRDEAARALAAASREVGQAAGRLEEMCRAHETTAASIAESFSAGEIDPRQAELSLNYLKALDAREREAREQLRRLEAERERLSLVAAEAAREAEATARLRERERERHTQEFFRVEQELLDEMAALAQARAIARGEDD